MSPREYVGRDGNMVSPQDQADVASKHYFIGKDLFDKKKNPSVESAKNKVLENMADFDMRDLQNMFEEVGSRCGVGPERLNFVEAGVEWGDIDQDPADIARGRVMSGGYDALTNFITLDPRLILMQVWWMRGQKKVEGGALAINKDDIFVVTLRTIIHEKIHAVSYNRLEEADTELSYTFLDRVEDAFRPPAVYKRVVSGYSEIGLEIGVDGTYKDIARHRRFDEGITDKLTEEILREYLARYQGNKFSKKETDEMVTKLLESSGYKIDINFADEMIKGLAQYLKMDERDVWHAIVRSKLEGVDFNDPDIKPILDAVEAREKLGQKK